MRFEIGDRRLVLASAVWLECIAIMLAVSLGVL